MNEGGARPAADGGHGSFAGKLAVVTGGGSGMGRERFRDELLARYDTDHVDLVFANAGIGGGGSLVTDTRQDWERTFAADWWGVYYCARAFLPLLIKSGNGASNGTTTFAAVNDLALAASPSGFTGSLTSQFHAVENAVGEMVAVSQDTGSVEWDTPLPSSPYDAATVTNDVVFTTTFKGYLYALDAATGTILFTTPMSAGSNAPVAVEGDYVIAGAGVSLSSSQRNMIIAYRLGATGKLPVTVGA